MQLNLQARKYKMMAGEITLFVLFLFAYSFTMSLFPVVETVITKDLMSPQEYSVYMVLMLLDLIFFVGMFFLGGIWFEKWRLEKNVRIS